MADIEVNEQQFKEEFGGLVNMVNRLWGGEAPTAIDTVRRTKTLLESFENDKEFSKKQDDIVIMIGKLIEKEVGIEPIDTEYMIGGHVTVKICPKSFFRVMLLRLIRKHTPSYTHSDEFLRL